MECLVASRRQRATVQRRAAPFLERNVRSSREALVAANFVVASAADPEAPRRDGAAAEPEAPSPSVVEGPSATFWNTRALAWDGEAIARVSPLHKHFRLADDRASIIPEVPK